MNDVIQLLTREEFNKACLDRDGHKCVFCQATESLCVHHIIERKLWDNGGYYETNGATVCPICHVEVEAGFVLPNKLFAMIGVFRNYLYPDGLDRGNVYDKWGQKLIWWDNETQSFIVMPNESNEKFKKAVGHAGGLIREVNGKWLKEFMQIDEVEDKDIALYIAKGLRIYTAGSDGEY